jgi:hypothetical protein
MSGWNAVVSSPIRTDAAHIFKVPHHGSQNAFSEKVWACAVNSDAIAVVTPYSRSNLPGNDEIARLTDTSREIYVTALPKPIDLSRPQQTLRGIGRRQMQAFDISPQFGLVRLRKSMSGQWRAEPFGTARRLQPKA